MLNEVSQYVSPHTGEVETRIVLFLIFMLLFSLAEAFFPYRKRKLRRRSRWPVNLGMIALSTILIKMAFPGGLLVWSHWHGNPQSSWISIVVAILVLDFSIYLQHVVSHRVSFLWRFHQVHHADPDLDVTTAIRFHPMEMLFSQAYKSLVVIALGAPALSVLIFEILLSTMAIFNHSNIHLPQPVERVLRLFLVTPQMHLAHHSPLKNKRNTNFGFSLSIWDRLLRTYTSEVNPEQAVGLNSTTTLKHQGLCSLLKMPFRKV